MKPIEYRARIDVDDRAPVGVEEYAREQLRHRILNDMKFQEEVLKELTHLKQYLEAQITGYEKGMIQVEVRTSLLAKIFGSYEDSKYHNISGRIDELKHTLFIVEKHMEPLKYQLTKTP